ncbi:unnamed protein product, partial [Ilex paraguariensis]
KSTDGAASNAATASNTATASNAATASSSIAACTIGPRSDAVGRGSGSGVVNRGLVQHKGPHRLVQSQPIQTAGIQLIG